ncbi:mediator of RNA polymerase II transcription subunit 8-like [Dreissena polymorpha]|uniref:Mediator of RNA polymerase II transcription subunit 8 n=1 Tax=Dreissena polymorpha TaxID=45954 RepID=A0A9D3YG21_DREPO|nr:mediator of RNA polymerase II transcription subunit 8-like [Dreissena polymorpha]KAH3697727.1 hypothetical protein DPMN_085237 [Dreissena polymorpha]
MQKEEKHLEASLEALIQRVSELKSSIGALIGKLEHEYETLNWPSVLDSFALLSGQLTSLGRVLKGDKVPALKNQLLLPILISPEIDESLGKLTEGRVMMFNHEIPPTYLRTKPQPEVEEKTQQLVTKATCLAQDLAHKQLNNLNKFTSNLMDLMNSTKEDWENDAGHKNSQPQMCSQDDTNLLVATALYGKDLRTTRPRHPKSPQIGMMQAQQANNRQNPVMTKAPSAIKTTIKSAAASHPYQRP